MSMIVISREERDSTEEEGKDWFADTADTKDDNEGLVSVQGQNREDVLATKMEPNGDGENEKLERHRRRGMVDDGTGGLRRERGVDGPETCPICEWL